jgi:hypothetical protein
MTLSVDLQRASPRPLAAASSQSRRGLSADNRSLRNLDWLLYQFVFLLAFPAFCLAEWLSRYQMPEAQRTYKALFAEARMNEHIALSYAFGMRRILNQCGRVDPTKRPS